MLVAEQKMRRQVHTGPSSMGGETSGVGEKKIVVQAPVFSAFEGLSSPRERQ